MTSPVQIPADVDREDRLLGELTARQLIILTTAALAMYLVWIVTGPDRLILFGLLAAPVGLVGVVLAFGRRDGVSADRLLWAALTQRRQTPTAPRPQRSRAATPNSGRAPGTDPCVTAAPRRRRVRTRGDRGGAPKGVLGVAEGEQGVPSADQPARKNNRFASCPGHAGRSRGGHGRRIAQPVAVTVGVVAAVVAALTAARTYLWLNRPTDLDSHQGRGWPSRKKPPVGPSSGRRAAHTMPGTLSATGRAPVASAPVQ